jgi:hypothetical protein
MNNSRTSVQRKQGVGMFKPVSWNRGRRLTSIGMGEGERAASIGSTASLGSSASMGQILNIEVWSTVQYVAMMKTKILESKIQKKPI